MALDRLHLRRTRTVLKFLFLERNAPLERSLCSKPLTHLILMIENSLRVMEKEENQTVSGVLFHLPKEGLLNCRLLTFCHVSSRN